MGRFEGLGEPAQARCQVRKAQQAFLDPHRVIAEDLGHSSSEQRYFCFGFVEGGVMTVRFTYRGDCIRIIGAGYWRKGRTIYEQENGKIH